RLLEQATEVSGAQDRVDPRLLARETERLKKLGIPPGRLVRMAAEREDAHAKAQRAARDLAPDRSVAEEAERLPMQLIGDLGAHPPILAPHPCGRLLHDRRSKPPRQ